MAKAVLTWLDRLDPGVHRRIKGLRLVTAFGIAWMASTAGDRAAGTQRRLSWRHSRGFRPLGQRLQAQRPQNRAATCCSSCSPPRRELRRPSGSPSCYRPRSRKRQIADFVIKGDTELGRSPDRLNISEATVKSHLTGIFRRLQLSGRLKLGRSYWGRA